MHSWGDPGIDWKGIGDAAWFIADNLRKWGRVPVRDWKEKYGTVRVYCNFGWTQLHDITHPGYVYARYPQWLWSLDIWYFSKIISLLNLVVIPYQQWLYTYLYGRAIRKWPHLRLEILAGADWSELLSKYGVHNIRTSKNGYDIVYDWHPDNFVAPKQEGTDGN